MLLHGANGSLLDPTYLTVLRRDCCNMYSYTADGCICPASLPSRNLLALFPPLPSFPDQISQSGSQSGSPPLQLCKQDCISRDNGILHSTVDPTPIPVACVPATLNNLTSLTLLTKPSQDIRCQANPRAGFGAWAVRDTPISVGTTRNSRHSFLCAFCRQGERETGRPALKRGS